MTLPDLLGILSRNLLPTVPPLKTSSSARPCHVPPNRQYIRSDSAKHTGYMYIHFVNSISNTISSSASRQNCY